MSTQPTTSTTVEAAAPTSAERLSGGEPYVLAFGGQATPWRTTLDELVGLDRELAAALVGLDAAVAARLAPVATDLLTITPRGARFLNDDAAPVAPATVATGGAVADTADISVPGILFAQHAAVASLPAAGVPVTTSAAPAAVIGHSQGVLGVALLQALAAADSPEPADAAGVVEVHAIARLIGAAAARTTRRLDLGTVGESTPMLSVRGVTRQVLDTVLSRVPGAQRISVGVTNGRQAQTWQIGRASCRERV